MLVYGYAFIVRKKLRCESCNMSPKKDFPAKFGNLFDDIYRKVENDLKKENNLKEKPKKKEGPECKQSKRKCKQSKRKSEQELLIVNKFNSLFEAVCMKAERVLNFTSAEKTRQYNKVKCENRGKTNHSYADKKGKSVNSFYESHCDQTGESKETACRRKRPSSKLDLEPVRSSKKPRKCDRQESNQFLPNKVSVKLTDTEMLQSKIRYVPTPKHLLESYKVEKKSSHESNSKLRTSVEDESVFLYVPTPKHLLEMLQFEKVLDEECTKTKSEILEVETNLKKLMEQIKDGKFFE